MPCLGFGNYGVWGTFSFWKLFYWFSVVYSETWVAKCLWSVRHWFKLGSTFLLLSLLIVQFSSVLCTSFVGCILIKNPVLNGSLSIHWHFPLQLAIISHIFTCQLGSIFVLVQWYTCRFSLSSFQSSADYNMNGFLQIRYCLEGCKICSDMGIPQRRIWTHSEICKSWFQVEVCGGSVPPFFLCIFVIICLVSNKSC